MSGRTEVRIFTLHEANREIAQLRKTVPELRQTQRDIERTELRLEILDLICDRSVAAGNPDVQEYLRLREEYHRKIARFDEVYAEFGKGGYLLGGLDPGVVHFLARRDGENVLLCWKEGEKRITHWHVLEEGVPDEDRRLDIERWDDGVA